MVRAWFWHFIEDTREGKNAGKVSWNKQLPPLKEMAYHIAAMYMDLMTMESCDIIFRELCIRQDELGMHLFTRGFTGEFRNKEYGQLVSKHPDLEALCYRTDEPNSPEENAELVKKLSYSVNRNVLKALPKEEANYLTEHLPPDFKRDSMDNVFEGKLRG